MSFWASQAGNFKFQRTTSITVLPVLLKFRYFEKATKNFQIFYLTSDALKIEPNSVVFTTVVGLIFNASDVII